MFPPEHLRLTPILRTQAVFNDTDLNDNLRRALIPPTESDYAQIWALGHATGDLSLQNMIERYRANTSEAALHLAAILNLNVQRRALARSLMAQGLDQLNTVPLQDLGIEDHPRAQRWCENCRCPGHWPTDQDCPHIICDLCHIWHDVELACPNINQIWTFQARNNAMREGR